MAADTQTVEHLVELVTRRVLLALAEDERRGTPNADTCTEECGSGYCVRHCADKVELIVQAGADRVAAGPGAIPAQPALAGLIDHTLLKPDATPDQVAQLCYEARKYGFAAVCINPSFVPLAAKLLRGSSVAVCTVVGFPLGATAPEVKAYEAQLPSTRARPRLIWSSTLARSRRAIMRWWRAIFGRWCASATRAPKGHPSWSKSLSRRHC